MLGRDEPFLLGVDLRRRQRLRLVGAHEQGERKISPDAVQRRHEQSHDGGFAELGAEPESPDRHGEKRLQPFVAEALPARGHSGLDPWLPHAKEFPWRMHRDEIALGRQLAVKSAPHAGPYILPGQWKSLSAGKLSGFCVEPAPNWYRSSRPPTTKVATTRSPRFTGEPASTSRNSDQAPLRSSTEGCGGTA